MLCWTKVIFAVFMTLVISCYCKDKVLFVKRTKSNGNWQYCGQTILANECPVKLPEDGSIQANFSCGTSGFTRKFHIDKGAIFNWTDQEAKVGFLSSLQAFNKRQEEKFQLSPNVEIIDVSNSFTLAGSICTLMEAGIIMMFGSRAFESSSIIEAYSQTFHVPYISHSFGDHVAKDPWSFQIHMRPSHTQALVDVIEHFKWRNFYYVYDSDEGLYRIQEINKAFEEKQYRCTVRMRRLVDVANSHEELRALDKQEEQENRERLILLDLSKESHYHEILKQIREVGMNKHGYCYILGTMDFLSLDMDRYQHGGVNITGFQLVNYSSPFVHKFLNFWSQLDPHIWHGAGNRSIHIDAALSYDAITVIYKTIAKMIENDTNVFKSTFRRGDVYNNNKTRGVPCYADPPVPWMHGPQIMETIKKLRVTGITGNIEFDEYGFRKDYKFDVYNVGLNNGPNKIGEWSAIGGVYAEGDEGKKIRNKTFEGTIYRVTSILAENQLESPENLDGIHHGHHNGHRKLHGSRGHLGRHGHDLSSGASVDRSKLYADIIRNMNHRRQMFMTTVEPVITYYNEGHNTSLKEKIDQTVTKYPAVVDSKSDATNISVDSTTMYQYGSAHGVPNVTLVASSNGVLYSNAVDLLNNSCRKVSSLRMAVFVFFYLM